MSYLGVYDKLRQKAKSKQLRIDNMEAFIMTILYEITRILCSGLGGGL